MLGRTSGPHSLPHRRKSSDDHRREASQVVSTKKNQPEVARHASGKKATKASNRSSRNTLATQAPLTKNRSPLSGTSLISFFIKSFFFFLACRALTQPVRARVLRSLRRPLMGRWVLPVCGFRCSAYATSPPTGHTTNTCVSPTSGCTVGVSTQSRNHHWLHSSYQHCPSALYQTPLTLGCVYLNYCLRRPDHLSSMADLGIAIWLASHSTVVSELPTADPSTSLRNSHRARSTRYAGRHSARMHNTHRAWNASWRAYTTW